MELCTKARVFWTLSQDAPVAEKQDSDLGHCRLWLRTAEGLPSKVAFVRRTGMLVTTQQPGLIRFPGFREFAALCVFEDPAGNELLRRMENPKHDQFESDRLPKDDRSRGRNALKRVTDWIRNEIKNRRGHRRAENRRCSQNLLCIFRTISLKNRLTTPGSLVVRTRGSQGLANR